MFYSYSPIQEDGSLKTFTDGTLKFSHPKEFNDPFDCGISLIPHGDEAFWINEIQAIIERDSPKSPLKTHIAKLVASKFSDKDFIQKNESFFSGYTKPAYQDNVGIFCMTKNKKEILMWSHYADKHRGFCIGFDEHSPLFQNALQVTYDDFPQTTIADNSMNKMRSLFLTKAQSWHYEEEWRLIDVERGAGIHTFDRSDIKEVIFGVKTDPRIRSSVIETINNQNLYPKLYQAELQARSFEIKINPL